MCCLRCKKNAFIIIKHLLLKNNHIFQVNKKCSTYLVTIVNINRCHYCQRFLKITRLKYVIIFTWFLIWMQHRKHIFLLVTTSFLASQYTFHSFLSNLKYFTNIVFIFSLECSIENMKRPRISPHSIKILAMEYAYGLELIKFYINL